MRSYTYQSVDAVGSHIDHIEDIECFKAHATSKWQLSRKQRRSNRTWSVFSPKKMKSFFIQILFILDMMSKASHKPRNNPVCRFYFSCLFLYKFYILALFKNRFNFNDEKKRSVNESVLIFLIFFSVFLQIFAFCSQNIILTVKYFIIDS